MGRHHSGSMDWLGRTSVPRALRARQNMLGIRASLRQSSVDRIRNPGPTTVLISRRWIVHCILLHWRDAKRLRDECQVQTKPLSMWDDRQQTRSRGGRRCLWFESLVLLQDFTFWMSSHMKHYDNPVSYVFAWSCMILDVGGVRSCLCQPSFFQTSLSSGLPIGNK